MITTKFAQLAGISAAAAVAMTGVAGASAKNGPVFGTPLTPPGITLQVLGKGQGYDLGKQTVAAQIRDDIAFTDLKGLTLYTYDKDPAGKATCVDECATSWRPMTVVKDVKPFGDWSLIARADGGKQWAYKGKALYTFVKDVDPGSTWGNSPARFGGRRKNGAGEYVGGGVRGSGVKNAAPDLPVPENWKIALAYPVDGATLPAGITIKEVPDALGLALVDYRNHTLYAYDGDVLKEKHIDSAWIPASAAQLAEPSGDFSLIVRADGIKQWAYKGKPLFTSANDLAPGDANGAGADKKWQAATVFSYYLPPGVKVEMTPGQGKLLTTAAGMTLYKRDGVVHQSGGGHSLRRGTPPRPAVGRDIGTDAHCDAECSKVWHPFLAPAGAVSQGFWTVATRADGARQWTYDGYALWTYDGDKQPGDMTGNDTFLYAYAGPPGMTSDAPIKNVDLGTPMDGASALYWGIVAP